jgi:hypothetical protein
MRNNAEEFKELTKLKEVFRNSAQKGDTNEAKKNIEEISKLCSKVTGKKFEEMLSDDEKKVFNKAFGNIQ